MFVQDGGGVHAEAAYMVLPGRACDVESQSLVHGHWISLSMVSSRTLVVKMVCATYCVCMHVQDACFLLPTRSEATP